MSETSPKFRPVSTRRPPRKAVAAKIGGIIGVVICVVIIVVVWFGFGTVARAVDDLGNDVHGAFDRAITATESVAGQFDEAVVTIDTMRADIAEVAASRTPDMGRLSNLQARLEQVSARYLEARVRYAEARENVVGVMSRLQEIAQIIPGTRVPESAGDTLAAVDAKIRAIDEAIVATGTSVADADPGEAVADALAARATPLKDAIASGAAVVHGLSTNLAALQTTADSTVDGIGLVLLLAALALSVLFGWVLGLNIALWLLGRSWERDAAGP